MAAIQNVVIKGYEERESPKPHTVYRIHVTAQVRDWDIWRRYSEFDDLDNELTKTTGSPPHPLPPKHKYSLLRSHNDPKLLEERKVGLELYLRAIISSKDPKWRDCYAFKQFLGIPITRQETLPTSFTLTSWLDEYQELQSRLRDVRADINKREVFSGQGDISSAHKSNLGAKQKLAGLLARIGGLAKGLQDLAMGGMNEGELQRRTDMVARLQDDCEKLSGMVSMARQFARAGANVDAVQSSSSHGSERESLLGNNVGVSSRVTRVFGAKPKETEATRPLDNHGLLGMQQMQIQQQDDQLSILTTILQRQRQLGEAISHEIATQIDLLDDLDQAVDQTTAKLGSTTKQMRRLG